MTQSTHNKLACIRDSTKSKRVTYFIKEFGRGLDFKCTDKKVEETGGVLVIQTFFSISKSKELQIQGRTARQGKRGSYLMILCTDNLVNRLSLSVKSIEDAV